MTHLPTIVTSTPAGDPAAVDAKLVATLSSSVTSSLRFTRRPRFDPNTGEFLGEGREVVSVDQVSNASEAELVAYPADVAGHVLLEWPARSKVFPTW